MDIWSNLPYDTLEEIAKKLRHMDLLYFGSVCKPWRFFYLENRYRLPQDLPISLFEKPRSHRAPFLLQSCKPDSKSHKYVCVVDEKLQGEIFLPEAANKWICGSSWGWLVMMDIRGKEISLLNPLMRREIKLPSSSTFPKLLNARRRPDDAPRNCFQFIYKAIITTDPICNPQDCGVMTLAGNIKRLFFCKLGDSKWTGVEGSPGVIEDLTHFQGRLYAITQRGLTISYDARNPNANEAETVACDSYVRDEIPKRYLVSSGRDLLQIRRIYTFDLGSLKTNQTYKFEVLKLVKSELPADYQPVWTDTGYRGSKEMKYHWSKLEILHDEHIFIGLNGSFSQPSSVHPNCKGSAIYFGDDCMRKHLGNLLGDDPLRARPYHDIGVYNMEDECFHNFYPNDKNDLLPAIWITLHPW